MKNNISNKAGKLLVEFQFIGDEKKCREFFTQLQYENMRELKILNYCNVIEYTSLLSVRKNTQPVNLLQNINWGVVERILLALYHHGPLKKTQITSKSGLNYSSCMNYLKWLNTKLGFVEFEISSDMKQIKSVKLSSEGISFCKNKIL